MTQSNKVLYVILILLALLVAALVFGKLSSKDHRDVLNKLQKLEYSKIERITLRPRSEISIYNLTDQSIVLSDSMSKKLLHPLNNLSEKFPGRGLPEDWEARLDIDLKSDETIILYIIQANEGTCVALTGTMGNPKYICNELQSLLEQSVTIK